MPKLRWFPFFLVVTLHWAACSRQEPDAVQAPVVPASHAEENPVDSTHLSPSRHIRATKPWKIALVTKAGEGGNSYPVRLGRGALQAAHDFHVQVDLRNPEVERYDVPLQIRLIEQLAKEEYDAMVVVPIDSNMLVASVEQFIKLGKPVIVLDTPLNSALTLTQLAFDNHQAGVLAANWVAQKLGGRGKVLILVGQEEGQNAIDRRDGFLDALGKHDIEILDMKSANWLRAQAEQITREWLDRFASIDAILAGNDMMALGAADAIERAGRKNILVTGVDANPEALEAILAERMHLTIEQSPEAQARAAVQLLIRHLERKETYPARSVWRGIEVIDRSNVESYLRARQNG
ncbi:sugar ABC transporter substrate-binding protein [Candidatus Symbiobacter mobilis]|uniref:Ribose transporter substrate-binding protein n=1 Tax=Candidatus Symbiobacter mobilis CR TaxID=946483 RepID=U5N637_9BURK|nr:sugar ABC transporter substrate-binding protein [Candidatus Symbiobacter mobilis]AGX86750.1 ribose transporter substrate-binding protein [Candidatus Symbiobacter mobilis CR]